MRSGVILLAGVLVAGTATAAAVVAPATGAAAVTTAWHDGQFAVNTAAVVGSSDVVLKYPNTLARESMPVGDGALGAAVWSADGLTAQLNRPDAMPDRESPGQVVIPGLRALTGASDYHGKLDMYDGEFAESGGGMTAAARVQANKDEFVVDVTGANPDKTQTASVYLWAPRTPTAAASGSVGTLAETWQDTGRPASTGDTFGTLAAITAGGRDVHASVTGSSKVTVTFRPWANGSFRIVVAAPKWTGGNAQAAAVSLLGNDASSPGLSAAHLSWWHAFWRQAGLIQMTSSDGSAQYLQALRTIDLYTAAAQRGAQFPGSQAGVADLFDPTQDYHRWDPSAYWQWNLRMQVQANLSAGVPELNAPYFRLYTENLPNIEAWTSANMDGRPGACVPETMRFNGAGVQYSTNAAPAYDCDAASPPFYNARTLSTGSEVSLWAWQEYLMTGDLSFLRREFPLMAASAKFLLAYATLGSDGYLHTYPANAHETQWDVHDPATDIAAMDALFPAVVQASSILHSDSSLAAQLLSAIPEIPPLPRTDAATQTQLLPPAADATGDDVIAPSYDPAAPKENTENIGLESVWPYNLIGDDGSLTALAIRTFNDRPNQETDDWSFDPIDAARLGLASDVQSTLVALTEEYQLYPQGFASFGGPEFYSEQIGVVAAALDEALAQDYNGVLQIAPAWPSDWNASGTVYIQANAKVDVQVRDGVPSTVVLQAGSDLRQQVRNPWPGQQVQVVDSQGVLSVGSGDQFTMNVRQGESYLIERVSAPVSALSFAPVGGGPAVIRHLGTSTLGVDLDCKLASGSSPLIDWVPSAGPTVVDKSGNGDNATVVGTPSYTTDPSGNPAVETGSSAYLQSSNQVNLGGFSAATFAARVSVSATSSSQVLFNYGSATSNAFTVLLKSGGAVRFQSPWANLSTSVKVPTGQFINLVVTISASGYITVYINGTDEGSTQIGPLSLGACQPTWLDFGAMPGGGDPLTGAVGQMEIWPRALSASQVAGLSLS